MEAHHDADNRTSHWLLGGLGVLVLAILSVAYSLHHGSASAEPMIPKWASLASWNENGRDGRYVLEVIKGAAPSAITTGIVTSDAQCAPDANDINHCNNEIALADGRSITVVNNHQMAVNRCLAPGDRVAVITINAPWAVARQI